MTEFHIRPGCILAWSAGPAPPAFSPDIQALFVFQVAETPNREIDGMRFVRSGADYDFTSAAFLAVVALSDVALDELLADDNSPGAARIRACRSDVAAHPLSLPLTAGARLAVESIRRCPFVGACRAMAFAARANDLLIEFLTSLSAAAPAVPLLRRLDEQVRAAGDLLAARLENPPTLPRARARGRTQRNDAQARLSSGLRHDGFRLSPRASHGTRPRLAAKR